LLERVAAIRGYNITVGSVWSIAMSRTYFAVCRIEELDDPMLNVRDDKSRCKCGSKLLPYNGIIFSNALKA
jgi:hypothetical protein